MELEIDSQKVLIDEIDSVHLVNISEWRIYSPRGRGVSYVTRIGSGRLLHRIILNVPEGFVVDHINHNGLDNRRENVRICTMADNACNRRKAKNSSSKFLGVYWNRHRNRWMASGTKNKKTYSLGAFNTEVEAAGAYDEWACRVHGDFANTNLKIGLLAVN